MPFAAIVTTNYDNLIVGTTPDSDGFGSVAAAILRSKESEFQRLERLALEPIFNDDPHSSVPTVQLHGSVRDDKSTLVCTREGYRRLLHGSAQYSTFVRTLLATYTVLYIGFSFTDSYINELRSEIMSLFQKGANGDKMPLAYAIMNDVHPVQQQALLRHAGLAILNRRGNRLLRLRHIRRGALPGNAPCRQVRQAATRQAYIVASSPMDAL